MGAAGGPYSLRLASGGVYAASTYSTPQGSDHIPGQIYHDAFISYAFGKPKTIAGAAAKSGKAFSLRSFDTAFLSGLTVQVGVRNVFNAAPPLDVAYDSNYYLSPYGDLRLRSFWVSLKKTF
jgi:outer membrane receptor protein involved in Fe transport